MPPVSLPFFDFTLAASGSGRRPSLMRSYIDQYSVSGSNLRFLSTKLDKTFFLSFFILNEGSILAIFSNTLITSAAFSTAYFF